MRNPASPYLILTICMLICCSILIACDNRIETKKNGAGELPNIIIILTDDQGYGDLASYGHPDLNTPHTDRMAAEGMLFTDFYVPAAVCTPTRAALLTGSYPKRIGLAYRVIFPFSDTGLHPDEITIADLLKPHGYASAMIGKWHLGHHAPFLPTRQGFDYYFGIPFSNDMGHHNYSGIAEGFVSGPLPVMRNEQVIEVDPDQSLLTRRFTDEAMQFITEHRDQPFFIYLAHAMPHVPIAASTHFEGRSRHGLYGDVVEEIDWSVGQLLNHLERLGIDDNTLVIFTSDNGATVWEGEQGGWVWKPGQDYGRALRPEINYRSGSNGPLRGAKGSTWEGGFRVPFLVRWPGHIPAGHVSGELSTAMDFLPTIAGLVGAKLPDDRIIDGFDIWPILSGDPDAESSYEALYYYQDDRLQAVRSGEWKLHVYRPQTGITRLLYNLEEDIGESRDVSEEYPHVVERLEALADRARADMGDAVFDQQGENVRPIGQL